MIRKEEIMDIQQPAPPPIGQQTVNLQTLVAAIMQAVQAQNLIASNIKAVFPLATGTAATATGGVATLPANPVGFIDIFVPSLNATVKVPYYAT